MTDSYEFCKGCKHLVQQKDTDIPCLEVTHIWCDIGHDLMEATAYNACKDKEVV